MYHLGEHCSKRLPALVSEACSRNIFSIKLLAPEAPLTKCALGLVQFAGDVFLEVMSEGGVACTYSLLPLPTPAYSAYIVPIILSFFFTHKTKQDKQHALIVRDGEWENATFYRKCQSANHLW